MLDKLLRIYRSHHELDSNAIWHEATFVFDANALLDLYRLPQITRDALIETLQHPSIKDRIWIPFQVAIEFLNNTQSVIGEQKSTFGKVKKSLAEATKKYNELTAKLYADIDGLNLTRRHSLINPENFINEINMRKGISFIDDFMESLNKLENEQPDVHEADTIKKIFIELFDGKIGEGLSNKELEELYQAGPQRYESKTPPGYEDCDKEGSYFFEDNEYVRKFGDLILWNEIIKKAQTDNIKYLCLITNDRKEDWWHESRGKRIGPRKELLNEIYQKATYLDTFHMYEVSSFLEHAKAHLKIDISETSIKEAQDFVENNEHKNEEPESGVNLYNQLNQIIDQYQHLEIVRSTPLRKLRKIKIKNPEFYTAIRELIDIVSLRSSTRRVAIAARELPDAYTVAFRVRKNPFSRGITSLFNMDKIAKEMLPKAREALLKENCDLNIDETEDGYQITVYVPKVSDKILLLDF